MLNLNRVSQLRKKLINISVIDNVVTRYLGLWHFVTKFIYIDHFLHILLLLHIDQIDHFLPFLHWCPKEANEL